MFYQVEALNFLIDPRVCVCVCMCVCVCVCVYIYMCVCVCTSFYGNSCNENYNHFQTDE